MVDGAMEAMTEPPNRGRTIELTSASPGRMGTPMDEGFLAPPEAMKVISSVSMDGVMLSLGLAWVRRARFFSLSSYGDAPNAPPLLLPLPLAFAFAPP